MYTVWLLLILKTAAPLHMGENDAFRLFANRDDCGRVIEALHSADPTTKAVCLAAQSPLNPDLFTTGRGDR